MPAELETREVLKRLSAEGWILRSGKGSHVVATRGTSMVTADGSTRVGDRDVWEHSEGSRMAAPPT